MFHHAEIIAVGSELLLGSVANTDAQYVSQKLAAVGVDMLYHTVVGDNPERLRQVTDIGRQRCDLLIFIGGLGPTYDDLTKDTVCAAFGVATEFHEDVMEEISGYFKNVFRREMPDCNRRQAYLPKGCTVLHNPVGTAPGCVFTADGVTVAMLPGVPHECRYLTDHALLPYLQARQESMILSHTLHVFGLTEPKVQEELGDLMNGAVNPSLAPYAKGAEVQLRLTAKAATEADCERLLAPLMQAVRQRLGAHVYGVDMGSPEQHAVQALTRRGLTVSAAESCTGGLIAKRLTDVPGASAAFLGGVVSYTNEIKERLLKVDHQLLEEKTAVCEEVARQMVQGAMDLLNVDFAIASTGIAGPGGGTKDTPVGTIWLAYGNREEIRTQKLTDDFGRDINIAIATNKAMRLMHHFLEEKLPQDLPESIESRW